VSELQQQLRNVQLSKAGRYEVRTHLRDESGNPLFINRLIREDSPYLLQHAHNPVDWFSWGKEAFAEARERDRPVFLSIGYSTCHWCHVMEAESFDNVEIARLLNESFISVKLDREQFPDIDDYYMTGVQIISGQGGWPMSNFLTPDGRPFYAATYFPPAQFASLLRRIAELWQEKREELEQSAQRVAGGIEQVLRGRQEVTDLDLERLTTGADRLLEREDPRFGGLAGAPKFPQEPLLHYLLDGVSRRRDPRKLAFLDLALTAMAAGGIYDQVAGGFHRYSTDAQWLVPHFEKMLYNQSQLSLAYLWAWRLTGNRFFLRVVRQTLDYVLREMQQPDGGFYSATDADSEEQEGLYFVWTPGQLRDVLNPAQLALVERLYEPTEEGNFEGANILALQSPLDSGLLATELTAVESELDRVLQVLLDARGQRIAPLRDDKLIVSWSAAMAGSLAWAGWELSDQAYLTAAERALTFMLNHNAAGNDGLARVCLHGEVSVPAQLEDYANLCEALVTLFDVTGQAAHLKTAARLMDELLAQFWNEDSGGFYLGPLHGEGPQLARSRSAADGATMSAYGIATQCLALLHERRALLECLATGRPDAYEKLLQEAIRAASADLDQHPPSHLTLLRAVLHYREGSRLPVRYGAGGRLRIAARRVPGATSPPGSGEPERVQVQFDLTVTPGYHVTVESPQDPQLTPLQLEPLPHDRSWKRGVLDIQPVQDPGLAADTACWGESIRVSATLSADEAPSGQLDTALGIQLRVQVCSEAICLAPETFTFRL